MKHTEEAQYKKGMRNPLSVCIEILPYIPQPLQEQFKREYTVALEKYCMWSPAAFRLAWVQFGNLCAKHFKNIHEPWTNEVAYIIQKVAAPTLNRNTIQKTTQKQIKPSLTLGYTECLGVTHNNRT